MTDARARALAALDTDTLRQARAVVGEVGRERIDAELARRARGESGMLATGEGVVAPKSAGGRARRARAQLVRRGRTVTVAGDPFPGACIAAGLPEPVPEYRFAPPRRWRFDYAWPAQKVALEVEGGVWTQGRHTRGKGFLGDMEKYNAAGAADWTVLRTTPDKLLTAACFDVLRFAFDMRGAALAAGD